MGSKKSAKKKLRTGKSVAKPAGKPKQKPKSPKQRTPQKPKTTPTSSPPKPSPPKPSPSKLLPPTPTNGAQKQARWMLLEAPYARDATQMHAILGYSDRSAPSIQCLLKEGLPSVPAAVDALIAAGKEAGIQVDATLVLVIPLDDRMLLASQVRELADELGCGFSRHIPKEHYPRPADFPFPTDTGSAEDNLAPDGVRAHLASLYDEWKAHFETGCDYLDAIGPLRHALRLGVRHFGWNNFSTAYTLRNLAATYRATGADDNERLCLFLIRILNLHVKPAEWVDGAGLFRTLLGQLADGCESMGDADLANELRAKLAA